LGRDFIIFIERSTDKIEVILVECWILRSIFDETKNKEEGVRAVSFALLLLMFV
jgi:hypothetical protein